MQASGVKSSPMMKKANNMNKARLVRPVSQRLRAGMAELEGAQAPSPFPDLVGGCFLDLLTILGLVGVGEGVTLMSPPC